MYTYTAGATGLDASMPPWVQEGGYEQWAGRLQDPAIREQMRTAIASDADDLPEVSVPVMARSNPVEVAEFILEFLGLPDHAG